jgi:hypothetical protein
LCFVMDLLIWQAFVPSFFDILNVRAVIFINKLYRYRTLLKIKKLA